MKLRATLRGFERRCFDTTVERLYWLAKVPFAPHLFDTALLTWTALSDPRRLKAMDAVEHQIQRLPGVDRCAHRYGGVGFVHGGREFAHLHGNGLLDVRLGTEHSRECVARGEAWIHHRLGSSAWVSYWIQELEDIPGALRLVQMALRANAVADAT
jgi:hypothetical protein